MSDLYRVPDDVVHAIVDVGTPAEKAFRQNAGVSIDELAETTWIAAGRIEAIEDGATPTADEIAAISDALDIPEDLLIDE